MKVENKHIGMQARWNPDKYPDRKEKLLIAGIPSLGYVDVQLESKAVYRVHQDNISFTIKDELFHNFPPPWSLGESRGSDTSIWCESKNHAVCTIEGGGILTGADSTKVAELLCELVNNDV